MEYLIKASGILLMLFLFYQVFLRKETFFKSIRVFFIAGLLIVLVIPLVEIPIYVEAVSSPLNFNNFTQITSAATFDQQQVDWTKILVYIYLAGVLFFSLKFLIQLVSLGNLLSKHEFVKKGTIYFVETSKNISPFSFFNIIVYNRSQFSFEELQQIINHEKAHAKQLHSIDTLLAHLLVITLWFNPFVWLYKKAVLQNLEFLADAYALELANNHKLYQLTILKTCSTNYCTELTNNFYNSLLKKRILMLHKNKSQNKSQWKYALLLPLLIAFISTFNTKIIAQEKKATITEDLSITKIEWVIDKNATKEDIKRETAFFEKEFDITLSFKGIKRNTKNEITAIKIDAKGNGLRTKFENAGTTPIKPIKVFYNSSTNLLSVGNVSNIVTKEYAYTITGNGNIKLKGSSNGNGNFVFVTSDTETDKDEKSKNIELKVISETDDKQNIWIRENGKDTNVKVEVIELTKLTKEGAHEVKIIHEGNVDLEKVHEIKIIKEQDKDGENVFIIKTEGDNAKKHKMIKKGDFIFMNSDEKSPLFILDGKEVSDNIMEDMGPDTIKKIEVIKGESATKKYGDKGKNGVVIITTKKKR